MTGHSQYKHHLKVSQMYPTSHQLSKLLQGNLQCEAIILYLMSDTMGHQIAATQEKDCKNQSPGKSSAGPKRTFSGLMVYQKGKQPLLSSRNLQKTSYRVLLLLHYAWPIPPNLVFFPLAKVKSVKDLVQKSPGCLLYSSDTCTLQTKESITNIPSQNALGWKAASKIIQFNSQTFLSPTPNIPSADRKMNTQSIHTSIWGFMFAELHLS